MVIKAASSCSDLLLSGRSSEIKRVGAMRRRAFGCAPCHRWCHGHPASIPHVFALTVLRAPLAGFAVWCSPQWARRWPAPQLAATGCAKTCHPRCWHWVVRRSRRSVHRHGARSGRASTPHQHCVAAGQGAKRFGLALGNKTLSGSGYMPGQPSCGDTGSALSPFGAGRPMRVPGLS